MRAALIALMFAAPLIASCGSSQHRSSTSSRSSTTTAPITARHRFASPPADNVYAHDGAGNLSPPARGDRALVYVPNSMSDSVTVISQQTLKVVAQFPTGGLPQHVTPAYNLKTLYVDNDLGNSLTPINPRTGAPGRPIPVEDPYNLYFTPDGRYAIVVAERLQRLDFRNPTTMRLIDSLSVPMCRGVDHMDFSADGRYAFASCEFSGRMVKLDLHTRRVVQTLPIGNGLSSPQDVKLSPDGRTLYTADQQNSGLWEIDPSRFRLTGFVHTGAGAHGLYPEPRRLADVCLKPDGRDDLRSQLQDPQSDRDLAASRTGQPRHGRRIRRRAHPLAQRSLQRRGVRNQHAHRPVASEDPGRIRTTRPMRLATARTLLPRPYRDHALTQRRRAASAQAGPRDLGLRGAPARPSERVPRLLLAAGRNGGRGRGDWESSGK